MPDPTSEPPAKAVQSQEGAADDTPANWPVSARARVAELVEAIKRHRAHTTPDERKTRDVELYRHLPEGHQ